MLKPNMASLLPDYRVSDLLQRADEPAAADALRQGRVDPPGSWMKLHG
jgi:hypothetical protein